MVPNSDTSCAPEASLPQQRRGRNGARARARSRGTTSAQNGDQHGSRRCSSDHLSGHRDTGACSPFGGPERRRAPRHRSARPGPLEVETADPSVHVAEFPAHEETWPAARLERPAPRAESGTPPAVTSATSNPRVPTIGNGQAVQAATRRLRASRVSVAPDSSGFDFGQGAQRVGESIRQGRCQGPADRPSAVLLQSAVEDLGSSLGQPVHEHRRLWIVLQGRLPFTADVEHCRPRDALVGAEQRAGDHGQVPTGARDDRQADVRGQAGKRAESMSVGQAEGHQGREDAGGQRQPEARGQGIAGAVGSGLGHAAAPGRQHHRVNRQGGCRLGRTRRDLDLEAPAAIVTDAGDLAGVPEFHTGAPGRAEQRLQHVLGAVGHREQLARVFLLEQHAFGREETARGLDVEGAEDAPDGRRGRAVEVAFAHGVVGHVAAAAAGDQDFGAEPGGAVEGHDAGLRRGAGRRDGGHQACGTRPDDRNRVFFHP